jgi:hypothetical protein
MRGLWSWLPVLAVTLSLVVAWRLDWPGPVEAMDESQPRLDVPAPLPAPGHPVVQSVTARHDGLVAVELLLVVYPPGEGAEPGTLTLRLLDDEGRQIHAASWANRALNHNDPLRFSFPPQARSSGREYRLVLEGTEGNRATVWGYSLAGYGRGRLEAGGEPQGGALRFETIYRYRAASALLDLWRALAQYWWLYPTLAAVLLLPGLALISPAWLPVRDPATALGVAVAGSIAVLPFAWLWWSRLGLRVNGVWVVVGLLVAAALAAQQWRGIRLRPSWETWLLGVVVAIGLAVRLLAVRDLVVPPWVDSPQHLLISQMMAETGSVPAGYRPWMPVDVFAYHFGFHALIASMLQIADQSAVDLVLVGGQVLNALAPPAVYAATVLLTGRRRAGLVAAFFVALLSLFPAYYVTWGRYTQLSGVLALAPLMGLAARFFGSAEGGRAGEQVGKALVLGLLLGALYLVHARVWVFALAWLPAAAGGAWWAGARSWRRAGRLLGWLAGINGLGLALVAPWHGRVGRQFLLTLVDQVGERGDPGAYNSIPWAYLSFGWERVWFGLAAAGLMVAAGWGLGEMIRARGERPRPGRQAILLIGVWVAAVTGLMNVNRLGVPTFGLINNNSWFISLFIPVGIILGWLVDEGMRVAARRDGTRTVMGVALGVAVAWSGLYGVRQNIAVVNPETVLAFEDDLDLIARAESLLPPDALVLVNSWPWLGEKNRAGSDAGYWILPLIGRQTTMPPIGYGMDRAYWEWVNRLNSELAGVQDWEAAETLDLLGRHGVTHVFIGARGGTIRPEHLVGRAAYQLLETNGAAWLFALAPDPP